MATKNRTSSAIRATIERGWNNVGFVAISETPANTQEKLKPFLRRHKVEPFE